MCSNNRPTLHAKLVKLCLIHRSCMTLITYPICERPSQNYFAPKIKKKTKQTKKQRSKQTNKTKDGSFEILYKIRVLQKRKAVFFTHMVFVLDHRLKTLIKINITEAQCNTKLTLVYLRGRLPVGLPHLLRIFPSPLNSQFYNQMAADNCGIIISGHLSERKKIPRYPGTRIG